MTNNITFLQYLGCVSPTYMDEQLDLNERMRAILVDWLIEVLNKCFLPIIDFSVI